VIIDLIFNIYMIFDNNNFNNKIQNHNPIPRFHRVDINYDNQNNTPAFDRGRILRRPVRRRILPKDPIPQSQRD